MSDNHFGLDPIQYGIGVVLFGIFALGIIFVLGIVILPIAAVGAGGYFAYRHYQTQKLYVRLPDPVRMPTTPSPSRPAPASDPRYSPEIFAEGLRTFFAQAEKETGSISCEALAETFVDVVTTLYLLESFHEYPAPPESRDLISRAVYQDKIEAWEKKTRGTTAYDLFIKMAFNAYIELRSHFPPSAFQSDQTALLAAPISFTMDADHAEYVAACFFSQEATDFGLFHLLREKLLANKDAIKPPKETLTFDKVFEGTPFSAFSNVDVPFEIPPDRFLEHSIIVAGSGHGKTQTLGALISTFLTELEPPAMVIIDSTGALVKKIERLAVFKGKLKGSLIVLDPEHESVPALNMFDVFNPRVQAYSEAMRDAVETEVVALFNYIFTSAENDLTSRQGTVFSYVVRLVLSMPGSTIDTLRQVLEEAPKGGYANSKYKAYIEKLDQTAQDFFKNQYFELKGFREQIAQRVYDLVQIPAFQRMFATRNKVDFFDELQNKGAIIVVNTSENLLKQDGSTLFGRYIIARTMASAFERATMPQQKRRPTLLIIDEAAPYFDDTFDKLLTRVRQFKLGVCVAFQHMEQVNAKLRSAIASNTSVKLVGGLGYTDSHWLARDMDTTPEFVIAQKRDGSKPPQWTRLACHVRNHTPQAVSLRVPFYALENMPQMTDDEHAEMMRRNRDRVAYSPEDPTPEEPIGPRLNPRPKEMENWRVDSADNPREPTEPPTQTQSPPKPENRDEPDWS